MNTSTLDVRLADALQRLRAAWGRDPAVGFLLGVLLGPIGVGLYLRSLTQFGLCAVAIYLALLITGTLANHLVGGCLCGLWAAAVVTHRARNAKHADRAELASACAAATPPQDSDPRD